MVTIITPTYNHARFIAECIESAQAQTYKSWEMLIVDDGSEDETAAIVRAYTLSDKRVRLIEQSHLGPTRLDATYNHALEQARGSWLAVLEGDDYWLPNRLEQQVRSIKAQTAVIYSAYFDKIEGQLKPGIRPPFTGSITFAEFARYLLLNQSAMIAVTQLIRRDCLEAIGGFQQRGSPAAVDMATMMELIRLPGEVLYVPQPLAVWRHHHSQSTNLRALELARFNVSLVMNYYDSLTADEQQALGIERRQLVDVRRGYLAATAFGLMRRKLRNGDKDDIVPLAQETWKYGGIKRKGQAVCGLVGAVVGFDFEWALALAERLNGLKT